MVGGEYSIKALCKNGRIEDLTENCEISIESKNCNYMIDENNKLKIGSTDIIHDDEVCVINAIFTDEDTQISYYASKTLYVSKILYNTFEVIFKSDNLNNQTFKGNENNYLFSIGYLEEESTPLSSINFSINLFSSKTLNKLDKTKDIEIYEIGSSNLNIETIQIPMDNNLITYQKRITLNKNNLLDMEEKKEVLLLFSYIEKISGRSILKPFTIQIYNKNNNFNIKVLEISIENAKLNAGDITTYSIYGKTKLNEENGIDITDKCTIDLISSVSSGVVLSRTNHTISRTSEEIHGSGFLKATYNNLTVYKEILFL